ncbi:ABC transporter ATP-binding protein [Rhizobacter sp. Root1221]|uniref:ABC transporter ATP-binding protein n=1 Tax=Rhizobacter sp. Root1221 TaxID=1736433 RepID=UPI0006FA3746|nr:ABC transporter ATP-binding protein [Rhizobacter sp. Root1221]KQV98461.1 sulfonate ABC transporter ATP-binding protein [Rhizobacter sp. Root1221]
MTAPALLDVHLHRKSFGQRLILQNVRLGVAEGEVVTLVGASGCGKSTLLRIVAGLDTAHDGAVHLAGQRLQGLTRDVRFVFQEPRLFPWLTVAQNIAFDLGNTGHRHPRVAQLIDEVGLTGLGDALPRQLSGGQAQRVAIARGLFTQPRVLLLDEPFSAVDAFTRMKLQDLLLKVARTHGITLLMVTHDIDEAVHLSDRVLVLEAGPGRVSAEVAITLDRPRHRDDPRAPAFSAEVRRALQAAHAF